MNMDKTGHGHLLHGSIMCNNFRSFTDLLRISNVGVNMQNKYGDTPILTCLKHATSNKFIKRLLAAGAKITIANKEKITPLSFAITRSCSIVQTLLEETEERQFLFENSLNEKLYEAVKTLRCLFNIFVTTRGLANETVIVSISTSNPIYDDNVAFRELSVLLDYLETAKDINKYEFYNICTLLLEDSIYASTSTPFKIIWSRVQHEHVVCTIPNFLHEFLISCRYENSEYIECLHLLLTSLCASRFTVDYRGSFNMSFYEELFMKLHSRNINKQERIRTIKLSTQLFKVFIKDVTTAYNCYLFNEEVVILVQHLNPEESQTDFHTEMPKFVELIENDQKLSVSNLSNLNFISRLSYRKLLNMIPEEVLGTCETLKIKKELLNKVPTLLELSKHASQKCVQQFYNIHHLNEFHKAVECLCLPNVLKRSLCEDPPLIYDVGALDDFVKRGSKQKESEHNSEEKKKEEVEKNLLNTGYTHKNRITKAKAFQVTGLDFAGPLYVKENKREKGYVILFTCDVTRAIQFELDSNLRTETSLLALRRFMARRGVPQIIYSDNAKTFKRLAGDFRELGNIVESEDIRRLAANFRIKWKFIVERPAWWGGFWERLVRSVKTALKASVGRFLLNRDQLSTLIIKIEATINGRPLTYITDDPDELLPLTPSHLLIGYAEATVPQILRKAVGNELRKQCRQRMQATDYFWKRWTTEYLQHLRSAHHNVSVRECELSVGDVMLIRGSDTRRLLWKKGVIQELIKGRDGKARTCVPKCGDGTRFNFDVTRDDPTQRFLACFKRKTLSKFVNRLLAIGARFTINASACIDDMLSLEENTETQHLLKNTLNEKLHEAVKTLSDPIIPFVINRGLTNETIVVSIAIPNHVSCDVDFIELSVFLNYLETAEDINKFEFYNICATLLKDSIYSRTATAFKAIWNATCHAVVASMFPPLLNEFIGHCNYSNSEFIECLHLMLLVEGVQQFTPHEPMILYLGFYEGLFRQFVTRRIEKECRIQTLLLFTDLVEIFFENISCAYRYWGFNEEVIILMQRLDPEKLETISGDQKRLLAVHLKWDRQPLIKNLCKLNFICRLCDRKFINMTPRRLRMNQTREMLNKKVLNQVPTLYEMSKFASHVRVQQLYDTHSWGRFRRAVSNLPVPEAIKQELFTNYLLHSTLYKSL
ncbi:hypothetical protein ILUMI_13629 [Ignelater luminosus]|uniref:Integrase catalytic domain-containing protein n=1 Tax=Ignelater luminosus TaxID=2038154 RepID=A0A8K0GAQ8_IGNLU|nr:hypothetical protein ILUMI_13629 [Ignelater luminosus]